MKNITRNSLFFILLTSTQLFAIEQERNIVGERKLTQEEKIELKNQRKNFQACEDCDKEEPVVILPITTDEPREEATNNQVAKKSAPSQPQYFTSHPGAIHHPLVVSAFGETVQLDDESIWLVKPLDSMKTLNWLTTDTILVLSPGWFSAYDYVLYNVETGARVNVGLIKQPRYNGVNTHWVVAVDYANSRVCLEDGSIWTVISFDQVLLEKWLINDTIIIGNNDGWFSASNPNILINVNIDEYVRSKCIY